MKHILVNPCLCHRVNNAYKELYRTNVDVMFTVDKLRNLCIECRNHPDDIKCVCPKIQLQRWVVDFDLCTFILDHLNEIKKFTVVEDEDKLKMLHKVLSIVKSLVNIFEDPKTPHFKAFRILENAIGALNSVKNNEYAEDIAKSLKKY